MIEAAMIWNEPNNKSHWGPEIDPGWSLFAETVTCAGRAIRDANPAVPRVLGGISPIDPTFIQNMQSQCALDHVDVVAVHGFPLDWNLWQIHEWPAKLDEIRAVTDKPVWVTEVGVSTFGAGEVRGDPGRQGQARWGRGGGRVDLRGGGGAGGGPAAHRRASDRQVAPHPLVQPLRPAPRLGGHHAPPRGRGLVLLPALPHGA